MMRSRQIILANEPPLLRSMLRRVLGKMPALSVAGEVGDLAKLPLLLDRTEAHWVIVSLSAGGSMPAIVPFLLSNHPFVRIVGIAEDGSLVRIQGAGHVAMAESAWSLDQLVAALREQPALSTKVT